MSRCNPYAAPSIVRGTLVGSCSVCGVALLERPGITVKVRRGPIPWVSLCVACVHGALNQAWEAYAFRVADRERERSAFVEGMRTMRAVTVGDRFDGRGD